MNRNKMKTFLEIIYNCPFLLLLIASGFLFALFFDETGVFNIDKSIAAFRMQNEVETAAIKEENTQNFDGEAFAEELHSDNGTEEETENSQHKTDHEVENAGIRKKNGDHKEEKIKQKIDIAKLGVEKNREKEENRATKFEEYTPISIDSRYYSDAGKVALTTAYDYVLENESYFNDAVFLGDSRTLGISDYAGLDGADFFCDNGMTIFKLLEDKGVTYQKTGKKMDLKEVLQEKSYGKVYIMLGMNELGYGNTAMYMKQYLKVVSQIREWHPDAVIYIMANLHVSREKNNMETEFNNININDKNVASARLANGRDIFYLDCNPLFTDEEGYLQEELTFDGVHLYAQNYEKWRNFLFEHGVEKKSQEQNADVNAEARSGQKEAAHGADETE